MSTVAGLAIEAGSYNRAIETYKAILQLQPNKTAQYNLGNLYAQGKV